MKNFMPIIISIIVTAIISAGATYAIITIKDENTETKAEVKVELEEQEEANQVAEYELYGAPQTMVEGEFENTSVEIKSAVISENYEEKPIVIITYVYSALTRDADSFSSDMDDAVYQNGVALEGTSYMRDDRELKGDHGADVKAGYSNEFERAYLLNDATSDILVEVKANWLSTDDYMLSRTFEME